MDFLESWISKILPVLLLTIINAIFPFVSLVDLNSSQFILSGKTGCLRIVFEDISPRILFTLDEDTLVLSAMSFSDCFFISSILICNSVLFEIFLFLSTKVVSAIKVLWQFLQ